MFFRSVLPSDAAGSSIGKNGPCRLVIVVVIEIFIDRSIVSTTITIKKHGSSSS